MTIDLDKLEALAKAATPGPWGIKRGYCLYDNRDMHVVSAWETYSGSLGLAIYSDEAMANAKFLEAANPAAVLELIAELRKAIAAQEWIAQRIVGHHDACVHPCKCDGCPPCEAECVKCWLNAAREAVEEKK